MTQPAYGTKYTTFWHDGSLAELNSYSKLTKDDKNIIFRAVLLNGPDYDIEEVGLCKLLWLSFSEWFCTKFWASKSYHFQAAKILTDKAGVDGSARLAQWLTNEIYARDYYYISWERYWASRYISQIELT